MDELFDELIKFQNERDWKKFHTPENLAKSISIEANELLECFQWSNEEYDLEHVKEELADVIVYCQDMLDRLQLDADEIVNKKIKKAFEYGLLPIICCGESLEQREAGITLEWIKGQIKGAFADITPEQAKIATIAYEPIWAIGTGKVATSEQAQEVCHAIRECIKELYDAETAEVIRIQYGGSVSAASAPELFSMEDIDGGLVGGASLKADFGKIVNYK